MSEKNTNYRVEKGIVYEEASTERTIARMNEEKQYVSVIIKRNDEVARHPDDILEKAIVEGSEQMKRSFFSLLLSAISAGLILGFAAMAVAFAYTATADMGLIYRRLAMALVYPLGFIICIFSASQLFTEHTALAVYPYLDKKCSFRKLVRLWSIVLLGNLIGTAVSAGLISFADPVIQNESGYIAVAQHLIQHPWMQIFISAVLAGWLMALGGWLLYASSSSTAQILCIYIVTFLIGIGGLHHCVAGSAEMFVALFIDASIGLSEMGRFLSAAVLGNLLGGSFMVASLNYSHIRTTQ